MNLLPPLPVVLSIIVILLSTKFQASSSLSLSLGDPVTDKGGSSGGGGNGGGGGGNGDRGPKFVIEPPHKVIFSNSTGTVINCNAIGSPSPKVTWILRDAMRISSNGAVLLPVSHHSSPDSPGSLDPASSTATHPFTASPLRHIRSDGSLLFSPFSLESYRPDVHSVTYLCLASNSQGTIVSRETNVRAVITGAIEVSVYDQFVINGNTAVLKCHLNSGSSSSTPGVSMGGLKDLIKVTSWEREDGLSITSSLFAGSKYALLSNGDLVIKSVEPMDAFKGYRCKVQNKLTSEAITSVNSGKVIVTEPHRPVPAKITEFYSTIGVYEGESLFLPCLLQGFPVPSSTWLKGRRGSGTSSGASSSSSLVYTVSSSVDQGTSDGISSTLLLASDIRRDPRVTVFDKIGLLIEKVSPSDAGFYSCHANNSAGRDTIQTEVSVYAPLSVFLEPDTQTVDVGKEIIFRCRILGSPVTHVHWIHDGNLLKMGGRFSLLSKEMLRIESVHRSDRGMYQCLVKNERESAQASAQLKIGESEPQFMSTFDEQILETGSRISLRCVASGNPLPQITWTLDEAPLSEAWHVRIGDYVTDVYTVNSYVNITSSKTEDGGVYSCTAKNSAGMISKSARVNVLGPPMIRPMNNLTALSGQTLHIYCPYAGHPIQGIHWIKDGRRLPQNHRQKVHANGTLVVTDVQRSTDWGRYECLVFDEKGHSVRRDLFVNVMVSPVVEPFSFSSDLVSGRRAGVACVVSAGDLPIKIKWLKDGQPLDNSLGGTVSTADFTSFLSFSRVSRVHNGNYTCLAENPAASASYSAPMIVQEPPRWTIEPKDKSVILGHSVLFDARAEAFPEPIIRWKRSIDGENFKVVISNANIQTLENGSLFIREVAREDAGHYMVQAINGVGPGISLVLRLTVHVGAYFEKKFESHAIRKGDGIRLRCRALGEKPLTITWSKDRLGLNAGTESRYLFLEDMKEEYTESIIEIPSSDRRDAALFTCFAQNQFGKDSKNFQLLVQEPPDCPTDLKASDVESRSVSISWSHPFSGNAPLTNYIIEYRVLDGDSVESSSSPLLASPHGKVEIGHRDVPDGKSLALQESSGIQVKEQTFKEMIESKLNSYRIQRLSPHTAYQVRVFAQNALGISGECPPITLTTEREAPAFPPRDVKVVAQSSTSLVVSWKPPPGSERTVTGYYVGYKLIHSLSSSSPSSSSSLGPPASSPAKSISTSASPGREESFAYKTVEASPGKASDEHCVLSGLRRHSKYEVIVQAFNAKGAGPPSDHSEGHTLEFDPPEAPSLQIESSTSASLLVTWEAKDTNPILGFYLFHKSEATEWQEVSLPAKSSEYNLTGLSCGRRYHLYLIAFNDAGRGPPSEVISAKTDGSSPIAPTSRELIQSNSTFVQVNLNAWRSAGCAIQYFVVQYKPRTQREFILLSNHVLPEAGNLIITDLLPAKWYTLFLTATNEAGSTEAEYSFSTLTLSGELIPAYPLESLDDFANQVKLLMPAACVIIVAILLAAVTVVLKKKKRILIDHRSLSYAGDGLSTCDGMSKGCGELLPLNEYDSKSRTSLVFSATASAAAGASIGEADQDYINNRVNIGSSRSRILAASGSSSCALAFPENSNSLTADQIYFPSPYALSRVVSVYGESSDHLATLSKSCSPRVQQRLAHQQQQQQQQQNIATTHYDIPFSKNVIDVPFKQCQLISDVDSNAIPANHSVLTFNQLYGSNTPMLRCPIANTSNISGNGDTLCDSASALDPLDSPVKSHSKGASKCEQQQQQQSYTFQSPVKASTSKSNLCSNSIMKSAVAAVAALTGGSSFNGFANFSSPSSPGRGEGRKKSNASQVASSTNVPGTFKRNTSGAQPESGAGGSASSSGTMTKVTGVTNASLVGELVVNGEGTSYDCHSDDRLEKSDASNSISSPLASESDVRVSPMYTQVRKKSFHFSSDGNTFPSESALVNESNSANGEPDYRLILQLR